MTTFYDVKTNQDLFWFLFGFLSHCFLWLVLAIWLGQKKAGREEVLVWIFLNNKNLAEELCEHLTEKKPYQLATCWLVPGAGWCLTKLQPES